MSTTTNRIAIHGHRGWASSRIVSAIARASFHPVKILARPSSDTSSLPPNCTAITVDLDDQKALIAALQDVDILISLVGHEGVARQDQLVEAIPHTAVKLFVPSDLGYVCDEHSLRVPMLKMKSDIVVKARTLGVPVTSIVPGCLAESTLSTPMLGIDIEGNRIVYSGNGEHSGLNICTVNYVAAAYAALFPSTPVSDLQDRTIGLTELSPTGSEIATALKAHNGGTAPHILHHSLMGVEHEMNDCIEKGIPLALTWDCRRTWGNGSSVSNVGEDIFDVPGYVKLGIEDLIVKGKLEPYRELPPHITAIFAAMFGKADGIQA